MPVIVIYAFVFGAVLIAVDTLMRRFLAGRAASREVNDRLSRLRGGSDQRLVYEGLLKDRNLLGRRGVGLSLGGLTRLYRQTGLALSLQQRIGYGLLIGLVAVIGGYFLAAVWPVRLAIAAGLALAIVAVLLMRLRAKRIRKFVEQLPSAIDIIVRSLHAGHPLNAAISLVAREMPDPVGSEFGILSDQLTFGSELDAAMINLVERVGADELNLLAVTVSVQRNTGGNLAEVLENLAAMIRDRSMLRNKIKAVSAEGRITAMIMSAFPALLFLIISTLAPDYFDPIIETGHATAIVLGTVAYMSLGIIILFRLVRFDF